MRVLGLDVSTSCVGIAVVANGVPVSVAAVKLSHIEDLFDRASSALSAILRIIEISGGVDAVYVEESLQAFRPGMSTANTICSLAKMNGLVSFLVRAATGAPVCYVSAQTARKLCGLKTVRGEPVKKQVFRAMIASVLSGWSMPVKRNSTDPVDAAMDACDALVVGLAGYEMIRSAGSALESNSACVKHGHSETVSAEQTVRACGSVEIWKGSICQVSVSVVPVELRSKEAEARDTCD